MKLRPYEEADTEALVALFTVSVHALAVDKYEPESLHAWAPLCPDFAAWRLRFARLNTIIAQGDGGHLGFIAYEANGHIDLLFTAPNAARQGVASALLQETIERLATGGTVPELFTEASLAGVPFFQWHGFEITREQTVFRRGTRLKRFGMRRCDRASEPRHVTRSGTTPARAHAPRRRRPP